MLKYEDIAVLEPIPIIIKKKKKKRKSCAVDRKVEEFLENAQDSLLTFQRQGECKSREVQIVY